MGDYRNECQVDWKAIPSETSAGFPDALRQFVESLEFTDHH